MHVYKRHYDACCRDEDVGRLSVTELQGTTVTAFATGIGSSNASAIPLMDEIYIGGTSLMMVYTYMAYIEDTS